MTCREFQLLFLLLKGQKIVFSFPKKMFNHYSLCVCGCGVIVDTIVVITTTNFVSQSLNHGLFDQKGE